VREAIFLTALLVTAGAGAAQPPQQAQAPQAPAQAEDRAAVVQRLATALEENFVFPEVGQRYAQTLRSRLAAGAYNSHPTPAAFAEAVTADLQAVHSDRHLRLRAPQPEEAAAGGQPRQRGPGNRNGIRQSGWIADGVAYIDFAGFPGNEATLEGLRRFLSEHGNARVLIIDARRHGGGGLAEMDVLFPYLYARETELVRMDTRLAVEQRRGNPLPDGPALRRTAGAEGIVRRAHFAVPGSQATPLRTAQVFVLTSNRTASAAEHFSLSLKRTGRATLIGETTRGAGHYGGVEDLGGGYSAFIPVGRTWDPDTGQGWETVGVTPHVQVPADQALDEALRRAGVDPSQRRQLPPAT
jgi:hypothetical protein